MTSCHSVDAFQSLFSWNSPSNDASAAVFQSLFSWNSPSDYSIATCTESVSILVFVELALGDHDSI